MYIALRWYHSIINNLSAYISYIITSCSFDSISSSHLHGLLSSRFLPSKAIPRSMPLVTVPTTSPQYRFFSPSPSLYLFLPFNPLILFNAILASLSLIKKLCMIKQYSSLFFFFWVSFNPFVWVFWVFYTSKESSFIRCGIKTTQWLRSLH